MANLITSGLNKLPSSFGGTTAYRGIKSGTQQQIDDILARYPDNTTVPHGEFISAGSDFQSSFAGPNIGIRMEIELKPSTATKDISALSDGIHYRNALPSELLLPPGANLYVDSISPPDPNGLVTIFLIEQ